VNDGLKFRPANRSRRTSGGEPWERLTEEAQLARIDFVRRGEYTPIRQVTADPTSAFELR
jgi:hypothetical protein